MIDLQGKRILVTGGTGSLGHVLVKRLLSGEMGRPASVTVFSRDEAKQHFMRLEFMRRTAATDEIIYENSQQLLRFQIGDVRDYAAFSVALRKADVVFNAAALKQVPTCEYAPFEAVQTNIIGANNIVRAISEQNLSIQTVVGISTDKACKPINVMGMTKAIQERILIEANRELPDTNFVCVRYGNVIASRGSIVPLFIEQIKRGGPVTITLPEMTRFLLTLERAVDTVFAAIKWGEAGETFVPQVPAARVVDLAEALMAEHGKTVEMNFTGIRPGEKVHEIMVSEEEIFRTTERSGYYVILPVLPELRERQKNGNFQPVLSREYSSADQNISVDQLRKLIKEATPEIDYFK